MSEDERQPFHVAHDERPDSRVIQIIPANPGSWAELQDPGGESIRAPLACWALVEERQRPWRMECPLRSRDDRRDR
jgi:hypothetical protein